MVKNRYIKEYFRYDYTRYNAGKSGRQAKRNRRIGNHIIRQMQKIELEKEIKKLGLS